MKRKQILYPGLLLLLSSLLVILSYRPGTLYGSSCDWFAQHVSVAETMRQTILEEGTLFPGRLPLGGGNNIYDFSYYGYLRPDLLLACLLPTVPMEYVITAYSVAGYLASVLLFYILLKKTKATDEMALLGGCLFLCSGCFFQIHRQIMFVNYMPFLLGALLCVLGYHRTGKKLLLILMMFLIALHSYYYAISAWLVIYVFLLYTAGWEACGLERCGRGIRKIPDFFKKWWSLTWHYAVWGVTAAAMAGILLLPTAASVLNCAMSKDGGSASRNPWEWGLDFSALLYNGYGLGLTLLTLFLLVSALCVKKLRLPASFLLFSLTCGLVPLILNGFLYNRAKILMPFLPLVLVICLVTLQYFHEQRESPPLWTLLPVVIAAWLQYQAHGQMLIWVDAALVVLLFFLLSAKGRWLAAAMVPVLAVMCGLTFLFALELHRNEDMIPGENAKVSEFSEAEREEFYQDRDYRFDTFLNPYQTGNCLLAYGAGRTSMYTSTANGEYSAFFYDEIKNAIGSNNRVGLYNRSNPFFLYLMGVRYLETAEDTVPVGYMVKQRKKTAVLAERTDVLPLCYGTTELMSDTAYEQVEFPKNLEALTSYSIVPDSNLTGISGDKIKTAECQFHFTELCPEEGVDYEIMQGVKGEFTVSLKKSIENQILVVRFQVKALSSAAVTITINGITNKLSGASAPYPNHNENFTYLLSSPEPMQEFKIKTSGSYEISDVHIYSMDVSYLGGRIVYPLEAASEKEGGAVKDSEDGKRAGEVLSGNITMSENGWLITSLPIQPGYRAYVDGKLQEIETVNRAFVGFPLKEGSHEIQICYEPPLQRAGMAVSAVGWLVWGIRLIWEKHRARSGRLAEQRRNQMWKRKSKK